jgi:hypothetical protein
MSLLQNQTFKLGLLDWVYSFKFNIQRSFLQVYQHKQVLEDLVRNLLVFLFILRVYRGFFQILFFA